MVSFDGWDAENNFDLASILGQLEGRNETGRRVNRVRQVVVDGGQAQIKSPKSQRILTAIETELSS